MSDREWYEGLTAEELEGKHVLVTYDEGCVVSGRMVECNGNAVIADGSCDGVGVLWRDGDGLKLDKGVRDFRLVWDERDWEEIPIEDIQRGDTIVVNGRLLHLDPDAVITMTSGGRIFPVFTVSCALRRRHKLPTEPGFYRDGDGALYFLSTLAEFWVMETPEKWDCMLGLPEASKTLTPVHFVDGRAE